MRTAVALVSQLTDHDELQEAMQILESVTAAAPGMGDTPDARRAGELLTTLRRSSS